LLATGPGLLAKRVNLLANAPTCWQKASICWQTASGRWQKGSICWQKGPVCWQKGSVCWQPLPFGSDMSPAGCKPGVFASLPAPARRKIPGTGSPPASRRRLLLEDGPPDRRGYRARPVRPGSDLTLHAPPLSASAAIIRNFNSLSRRPARERVVRPRERSGMPAEVLHCVSIHSPNSTTSGQAPGGREDDCAVSLDRLRIRAIP
jgi:hypothetical protein